MDDSEASMQFVGVGLWHVEALCKAPVRIAEYLTLSDGRAAIMQQAEASLSKSSIGSRGIKRHS